MFGKVKFLRMFISKITKILFISNIKIAYCITFSQLDLSTPDPKGSDDLFSFIIDLKIGLYDLKLVIIEEFCD